MGIPMLISVTAATVVGVGGFLLGWRWPRSAARREEDGPSIARGTLPWSLMAIGLVAVAATNAFVARSVGSQQPVTPAPVARPDTTADQAGAEPQPPDQSVNAPAATISEPAAWPALPDCFVDDYLVHETSSAREPRYVAENRSSVFESLSVVSMMIVDGDRIIGGLRISFSPAGQGSFSAHDVVDASCRPVGFSEDEGDAAPEPAGTGQLTVTFILEGQPYELEVQREGMIQASATLRPAG